MLVKRMNENHIFNENHRISLASFCVPGIKGRGIASLAMV
jgi:hypothetical protein